MLPQLLNEQRKRQSTTSKMDKTEGEDIRSIQPFSVDTDFCFYVRRWTQAKWTIHLQLNDFLGEYSRTFIIKSCYLRFRNFILWFCTSDEYFTSTNKCEACSTERIIMKSIGSTALPTRWLTLLVLFLGGARYKSFDKICSYFNSYLAWCLALYVVNTLSMFRTMSLNGKWLYEHIVDPNLLVHDTPMTWFSQKYNHEWFLWNKNPVGNKVNNVDEQ